MFQTTNQIYACIYIYIWVAYIYIYTFMYAHEIIPVVVPKYFGSRHDYPKDGSRYGDSESDDPKTDQNLIEIVCLKEKRKANCKPKIS